jgi:hypothetical protein
MPKQTEPDGWLAEWVREGMTSGDLNQRPAPKRVAGVVRPGDPKYLTLDEWAARMFGDEAPHNNTLLRWVREGHIQPQPRKIGRRWFVKPDAEYVS